MRFSIVRLPDPVILDISKEVSPSATNCIINISFSVIEGFLFGRLMQIIIELSILPVIEAIKQVITDSPRN